MKIALSVEELAAKVAVLKSDLKNLTILVKTQNGSISDLRRDVLDTRREVSSLRNNQIDGIKVVMDVLKNNGAMQKLKEEHTKELKEELISVAKKVVSDVANEEENHVMQKEIKKHADMRVDAMLKDQKEYFDEFFKHQMTKVNEHLEKTREENDKSLKNVRNAENQLKILERKLVVTQIASVVSAISLTGIYFLH